MTQLLISGGHIIDPGQGIDEVGSILITGDRITRVGGECSSEGVGRVLHAEGLMVCPGLIDLHCHLREPGSEDKETIATGTRAAARGGFTTICCMPNTEPPIDSRAMVEFVLKKAADEGVVRVLPIGCISKGRAGEELVDVAEMAEAGAVALSDDGSPVSDARLMSQALERSRLSNLLVIDHCEDRALTRNGVMNKGVLSVQLRLEGTPSAAEEIVVARDIDLLQSVRGRVHIAHVSTAGAVDLVRCAKQRGIAVTAEATPHHLTMTEQRVVGYNTNAKVNPPLRTAEDVAALILGINEGVIDIIATDHAPHTRADKACDFNSAAFGISGLETALASVLSLVHSGLTPMATMISRLTTGPARLLDRSDIGTLTPGAWADVTVFDPQAEWVVEPSAFASKGKNTPLAGQTLKGKVMATVCSGQVVYVDERMRIETAGAGAPGG
ncbi:MAG: dihydroorotase [Chloroflexota bacterium]|nr:dihydroorotase [Chloroflexota bacterium]